MRLHRIWVLALLAAALPASVQAQKTTYDFDKTAPFSQFRTYTMREARRRRTNWSTSASSRPSRRSSPRRGSSGTTPRPTSWSLFHVAFDEQKDISTYSSGPMYGGYGYGWGGGWGGDDNRRARQGDPGRHARDRHGRREEEADGVARSRDEGDRHQREAREARQQHHQGGGEDLQELSAEGEDMMRLARAIAGLCAAATVGLGDRAGAGAPETFTATASVKTGRRSASAPLAVTVTRYASAAEREAVMAAVRDGGTAAARKVLAGMSDAGFIQLGERSTPIKFAAQRPMPARAAGDGRDGGADPLPRFKPARGEAAGRLRRGGRDARRDRPRGGVGELVPAAKVGMDANGALLIDDYGATVVWLNGLTRARARRCRPWRSMASRHALTDRTCHAQAPVADVHRSGRAGRRGGGAATSRPDGARNLHLPGPVTHRRRRVGGEIRIQIDRYTPKPIARR